MLSKTDNELLTRVGPGTAMGDTLRQYWMPALLSTELPDPDGAPLRLRLLGEDLVAFRDSSGRVGLVANNCPHRGASLFFGRNEEHGLRCVYHGWKFDLTGACVDMPNEPAESNFKSKVRLTSYPCQERNGLVWAYMGPLAQPPALPALEWNLVPEDQYYLTKRVQACNWAQSLEGGIDSSHGSFLHSDLQRPEGVNARDGVRVGLLPYMYDDRHPRFEVMDTPYGAHIAARRSGEPDSYYWRITEFLLPWYTMIPPFGKNPTFSGHAWVPMDDEHTVTWSVHWHPTRALTERELDYWRSGKQIHSGPHQYAPKTSAPAGAWVPAANVANDYFIDYEAQRNIRFTGLAGIWLQDQAMQESMGAIYDRTKEHLGASDTGVIKARQLWLRALRNLRDQGLTPSGVMEPETYRVRPVSALVPRNTPWLEATRALFEAVAGSNYDAP
ncbi:MAG: aromatic ring-hydroxylating dioxygenase subunit alpha [Dehalococcoidia bacterium]|nr:aromatic ring-hydroxylating dioxygenase subunit alpha [Dehalococcoidia bacterium]